MRAAAILWLSMALLCCSEDAKRRAESQEKRSALTERAEACFDKGRYDCAMESYAKLLKKRPTDPELLNRFGISARLRFYVTGEADYRDQELEALRKAARRAPRRAPIQVNYGTTCWEMGLRSESSAAYGRALALQPGHPDAALMRDRIKRSTKEVEDEKEE